MAHVGIVGAGLGGVRCAYRGRKVCGGSATPVNARCVLKALDIHAVKEMQS
jgi:hypothetical protein